MNNIFSKLLKISENYCYIYPVISNSNILCYNYGPTGELLRNNIFNEWIFSNVTCRDGNAFPFYSCDRKTGFIDGIKDHYTEAKKLCGSQFPFSLVYARIPINQTMISKETEESKYFSPQKISQLRSVTFTSSDDGLRYFHYWLRQRKIWWRKFSGNPGRFAVTDINTESENVQFASIQATFPWGVQEIEIVKCFSSSIFDHLDSSEQQRWKLTKAKKPAFPCIVESTTNLEMAAMCFLCDSYNEDVRLDTETPHQVMKLHRKLAPYKIAVTFHKKTKKNEDLFRLGEFLTLNLKKIGISTLYLIDDVKSLEEKFQFYDLLGVPYVAVLRESTLSDGIFGLRCRETTLEESLHISNLSNYVEMLLKNY